MVVQDGATVEMGKVWAVKLFKPQSIFRKHGTNSDKVYQAAQSKLVV